jgi:hypothetical protein
MFKIHEQRIEKNLSHVHAKFYFCSMKETYCLHSLLELKGYANNCHILERQLLIVIDHEN